MNIILSRVIVAIILFPSSVCLRAQKSQTLTTRPNLAVVATPSSASRYGPSLNSLHDGLAPTNQGNRGGGNRQTPARTQHWVEYIGNSQ